MTDTELARPGDQVPRIPLAQQMLQMLSGFEISQALYTVAKLGVATALVDGPRTVEDLAVITQSDTDALRRIIRFLATLGVFRTNDATVEITPLGATLADGPVDSVRSLAMFLMDTHYAPFAGLAHTARTGEMAALRHFGKPFLTWITDFPELVEIQNGAMANMTNGIRAGMFADYRLPAGDLVVDLGGADGTVLSQLLANVPERRGILFDQPNIVSAAPAVLAAAGVTDRVRVLDGDFFDSVPRADVYVMSHILHDWDDEPSLRILRNIAKAAAPGW